MDIYRWCFCLIISTYTVQGQPPPYSLGLEESLRTELFTNYTVQQRPSQKVTVAVSFTILTVNDLNIKDQTLSLSGYLTLDWQDSRLTWFNTTATSQDFTSINFMFAMESELWTPAILIENAVDGISAITDDVVPLRITQSGRVIWNPAGIYKVSCESDTKYYPMDTQSCYLKVSGWTYTSTELELRFKIDAVEKSFYSENGEWKLLTAEAYSESTPTRGGQSFSSLLFLIKLQRRLLFHFINTLFPVALMAILIAFVFKLPVDSGEKIGFSLTVLLSYAVYLTLISDNIPSTSVTACFLSVYLAFILLMATIAVCCATFVINLHMRTDDEKISDWLKNFTCHFLMKLACWERSCCQRNRKVTDSPLDARTYKTNHKHAHLSDDNGNECTPERHNLTWKELSEIMDKVFFNIYMFLTVLSTLIMFALIIGGYYSYD